MANSLHYYNGHTYFLTDREQGTSWKASEAQAVTAGGHLVTINDQSEQDWLNSTFQDQVSYGDSLVPESYWIGLYDQGDNTFEWVSRENSSYTNWASGEPNNLGEEDYVELNPLFAVGQWNDRSGEASVIGGRGIVELTYLKVGIDIKPDDLINPINPNSKGVIPVAIFSTDGFDATSVDPDTLRFGRGEAQIAHKQKHIDVNGDGHKDLLVRFRTQDIGLLSGDTEIPLRGQTYEGFSLQGKDSITLVGSGKQSKISGFSLQSFNDIVACATGIQVAGR